MISRLPRCVAVAAALWPALLAHATPEYRFTFTNPSIGAVDAPWVLEYFSAPDCGPCLRFEKDHLPALLPEVAAGRLRVIFRDLPPDLADGDLARKLFCLQELPHSSDVLAQRRLKLKTRADDVSLPAPLPGRSAARWEACLTGGEADQVAFHNLETFSSRGFHATPSFVLVASDEPRRPALAFSGLGAPDAIRAALFSSFQHSNNEAQ